MSEGPGAARAARENPAEFPQETSCSKDRGGPDDVVVVAESAAMKRVMSLAQRFARTKVPILLVGATGTGKELVAQYVHRLSGRTGPMVDVDCGAFPRDMIESLLFGHRRGAFTGAIEDVQGLIAAAERGTLFLDELSSLSAGAQVTLLRVLETRRVRRLGDTESRLVEFRLIAAVRDGLSTQIQAGAFRLDLFQRLAGVVLDIPPLDERREDIVPLARFFAQASGRGLEESAEPALLRYAWPGNVRELRSAIERAGFLAEGSRLGAACIVEAIHLGNPPPESESSSTFIHGRDGLALVSMGQQLGWDPGRMAAALGIARSTLFRRLRALGISLRSP
jgi:DNA-binding NtrC family response regulator